MAKRILALVLACLLLGAAALAEVEGPLFEADSMSSIFTEKSGAFIFTEDGKEGLVGLDGNVLAIAQFGDLSYVDRDYYSATNEGGFNTSALINRNGEALTPYAYSDFRVVGPDWAVGVVLEGTNDKDSADYTVIFGEYDYAKIVRNDIFYLPEKKQVGSLERSQYYHSREAGNSFLLVEDRDNTVTAYDTAFNALPCELTSIYNADLVVKSENELSPKALYSAVTGEKLADVEYTYLSNISVGYTDFVDKDTRLHGILNAQGEVVCPPSYSSINPSLIDGHYIRVSQALEDGSTGEGLLDLDTMTQVVPCRYARIYTWGQKSPINNGYVCVEEDGKLGFVDLEGNVTCPVQYSKDNVKYYGCTLGATDLNGMITLIAADGTVTPMEGVTEIPLKNGNTDSDGYFLTVKNADGQQGVVDWHGQQVVDFVLEYDAGIYAGDCLFTGTSLYRLGR